VDDSSSNDEPSIIGVVVGVGSVVLLGVWSFGCGFSKDPV